MSLLALLFGVGILGVILVKTPEEKIGIVASTLGLFLALFGIYRVGGPSRSSPLKLSNHVFLYLLLVIAVLASVLSGLVQGGINIIGLAALALLLPLCKLVNVSRGYSTILIILLVASIGYNVFHYYPLITNLDPWGYLSVASSILQKGHYSVEGHYSIPTDRYYFPFPVMSIAPSILASVTGLNLELSLLIFPGSLVLMQPLLVFLLCRKVFHDEEAALLSAFVVLIEPEVMRYVAGPIAQSTAMSILLLLLTVLFSRVRSRARVATALVLCLILAALHGAVALISLVLIPFLMIRESSAYRGMITSIVTVVLGYIVASAVIDSIVRNIRISVGHLMEFILAPQLRTGSEIYGGSGSGLGLIWWGMPVSLALLSILTQGRKQGNSWAYAGLSLLGFSFAVNVVAPQLVIDRYGGLAAWLILAIPSGRTLKALSKTSRQLLMLIPIMFLVSMSCIVNPSLSPQYAHAGYHDLLPTTAQDRTALEWASPRIINHNIFADSYSARYLIFIRYESGVFSYDGVNPVPPNRMPMILRPGGEVFTRCSSGLPLGVPIQRLNIVYYDGCDLLETPAA